MKALNKQASKVMDKLLKDIKTVSSHTKIDNTDGNFMPVHIEVIGKDLAPNMKGLIVSIAHYYKLNGDMICDPDMTFLVQRNKKILNPRTLEYEKRNMYYPLSFEMGGFRYEESVYSDGKTVYVKPQLNKQHKDFANQWLLNIKNQQNL